MRDWLIAGRRTCQGPGRTFGRTPARCGDCRLFDLRPGLHPGTGGRNRGCRRTHGGRALVPHAQGGVGRNARCDGWRQSRNVQAHQARARVLGRRHRASRRGRTRPQDEAHQQFHRDGLRRALRGGLGTCTQVWPDAGAGRQRDTAWTHDERLLRNLHEVDAGTR